jgi:hypothetical protein
VSAIALGLEGAPSNPGIAADPSTALARDRTTFLTMGSAAAITFGLGGGLGVWIGVGIGAAIAVGLGVSFLQAAYGRFLIARCWLALHHYLPWRLMGFLADAHQKRGVLRQVGAVYQFRHAELQRRLSNKTWLLPARYRQTTYGQSDTANGSSGAPNVSEKIIRKTVVAGPACPPVRGAGGSG